jgi:Inhibitor of vertebrate lysozyme (Ivy)
MHRVTRALCLAGMLAIALSLAAKAAPDLPYLYQRLENPTYKAAFSTLFRDMRKLEPWLRGYIRNRNGVDTPGRMMDAAGKQYELYAVCEPHNCAGNFIYVLFLPGGKTAWALLTKDGDDYRFFGRPDQKIRGILMAAAKE